MFREAIKRIKLVTGKEKQKDICAEIKASPQNYRVREKKEDFDANWAFRVSQKYGVSTEWILTGKGPKRLGDQVQGTGRDNSYLLQIGTWFQEVTFQDSRKKTWFEIQFEKAFPEFVEWLKDREVKKQKAA